MKTPAPANQLAERADRDRAAWAALINRFGQLADDVAAIVRTPGTEQEAVTVADSIDLLCEQLASFRRTLPQSALDQLAALAGEDDYKPAAREDWGDGLGSGHHPGLCSEDCACRALNAGAAAGVAGSGGGGA